MKKKKKMNLSSKFRNRWRLKILEQFKIVFAGLANAGKTSIILTLKRQFSELSGIKPTKGIDRSNMEILGFDIVSWDLGGQEIYRAEYKRKEAVIFSETEIFYFIIDMQDIETYEDALQYFQEIVEIYKLVDPKHLPYFIICLNKMDPNLLVDYNKQIEEITSKISDLLKGAEFKIFLTSIYNLQSVIEAFSWGISKFLPKQSELELILKQFLAEFPEINAVNILEKHSMFLVQSYRDDASHKFFNLFKEGVISIIEKLGNQLNILTFDINNVFKLYVEKLTILQRDYFFFFMGKDIDFNAIQNSLISTYYARIQTVVLADIKASK